MLNKLLPRTPLGIALTATSIVLVVSPEARKITRRAVVKGIATVLSAVDQLKAVTASTQKKFSGLLEEAKDTNLRSEKQLLSFGTELEPDAIVSPEENPPIQPAFNVINDDYIKRNIMEAQSELQ